ncbi:MAG: 2-C-methyl-D-erythritol 4-phosphate cytidylyltransferase [Polaromonas sp.]|nr:2-C-methyl-D-erythritol 4-phosphate cytidylyltransferase [Polaromonas sp.]
MTTARAKAHDPVSVSSSRSPELQARLFVLIPCAGHGSRAGTVSPKQYEKLCGQPMVRHTVQAFRSMGPALSAIWVVVSPDDVTFAGAFPDFGSLPGERLVPQGGATRAATVRNGLLALLAPDDGHAAATVADWVLVHDAARCLITPQQVAQLVDACRGDAVGGLLAQKLPDTLKRGSGGRVAGTLDRSDKWLAQTPQMFRIGPLLKALEAAGDVVTDESSAMEAAGLSPLLVAGSAQNFKVTYPEDFALAEAVLASRRLVSQPPQLQQQPQVVRETPAKTLPAESLP